MGLRDFFASFGAAALAAAALSQSGCQRVESRTLEGDALYEMEVPDMVCEGCAIGITEALEEIKGVEEVEVLVAQKRVRIGVATALLGEEQELENAVKAAGYKVTGFARGRQGD